MKTTFSLALLLSCLTGFFMASSAEKAAEVLNDCMTENGVSTQDLMDLKSGKLKPEDVKDNMKCATQCIFVKFGFMNDKGTLLNDQILAHFPDANLKAQVQNALTACGSIVGSNPCDTAFKMMVCFEKHANDMLNI
ncbi:uncharacterized protein LOC117568682 [Drosophila albomicans]|uniref:Uncharacterized protein LOC117568682 n=1 Tax=Drosophila albomicans TaxID=7291 RepID=A0A6P8WNV9_DROAB|nr:uncharacterized protein LOC117568682 [Drosophila albomicans]